MENIHVMWDKKGIAYSVEYPLTYLSPLDIKEIKLVNPKGNQPWIFTGRTGAEEPILLVTDVKTQLRKKLWYWERLRAGGEGGNRGWDGWQYGQLHRHELEQTPGDSEGQGSLVCCSPWGHKEWDTTERLNNSTTSIQDMFIPFKVSTWRFVCRGLTVPPFYGFGSYLI